MFSRLWAGFRGGLRGRCRFRGRGSFGDGGLRTAAHHPDAAAVAGNRLHQRLKAIEGHSEAALSLPLLADPVAFDNNGVKAAIGAARLVCGNAHAVVAPLSGPIIDITSIRPAFDRQMQLAWLADKLSLLP